MMEERTELLGLPSYFILFTGIVPANKPVYTPGNVAFPKTKVKTSRGRVK